MEKYWRNTDTPSSMLYRQTVQIICQAFEPVPYTCSKLHSVTWRIMAFALLFYFIHAINFLQTLHGFDNDITLKMSKALGTNFKIVSITWTLKFTLKNHSFLYANFLQFWKLTKYSTICQNGIPSKNSLKLIWTVALDLLQFKSFFFFFHSFF